MAVENGEWIIHGVSVDNPKCIKSADELIEYVNKVGFLPLFKNEIDDFSVEERTQAKYWWSGNEENDPWEWRRVIAKSKKIAYGKFFDKKAGFVSLGWFPTFANIRRDGYDFDALWEDGLAKQRQKKIMDLFSDEKERFSFEIKRDAGFGKGGEKNFEGTLNSLQMMTYLVPVDFRQRRNKNGELYGWAIAMYCPPEQIWGYDFIASGYKEKPHVSREKIFEHLKKIHPDASDKAIRKIIG